MPKKYNKLISLLIITALLTWGCSAKSSFDGKNEKSKDGIAGDKIAYVSASTDSIYEKTFKDLRLGMVFDFNLRLPAADKSWVDLWVEGYQDGKPIEGSMAQISFGSSPNESVEGHMGFGIIAPGNDKTEFFLYAPSCSQPPVLIDEEFFKRYAGSGGSYAIGNETIGLKAGEERVLAVYRKADAFPMYDLNDPALQVQLINEKGTVFLFKIKVYERNEG